MSYQFTMTAGVGGNYALRGGEAGGRPGVLPRPTTSRTSWGGPELSSVSRSPTGAQFLEPQPGFHTGTRSPGANTSACAMLPSSSSSGLENPVENHSIEPSAEIRNSDGTCVIAYALLTA